PQSAAPPPPPPPPLPDMRVVAARRADEDVLQSTLSMVASQMAFQSDAVSLEQIESLWRRKLALRNRRMDAALGALAQPCTTVDFEQLNANWRAAMARVYADLGLDLTPGALAAMERERSRAAGDAHHAHRPQIARFELGQALLPTPGIKVPTERR
ncbi:MAG: sulfotransferase, partial [Qipengyuania sp.]